MLWKWESVSKGTPLLGDIGGRSFLGLLREGKHFYLKGNFYDEFERYVNKRSCRGHLFP
jgi:hypothetical protein